MVGSSLMVEKLGSLIHSAAAGNQFQNRLAYFCPPGHTPGKADDQPSSVGHPFAPKYILVRQYLLFRRPCTIVISSTTFQVQPTP